jgi:protocatechuate 3,4-dioxygenase beta subunit
MGPTNRKETDVEPQLTRRQALGAAAGAGAALVASGGLGGVLARLGASPASAAVAASSGAAAACATLTPSMTEGPYWVDEALRRADVRANTATASSNAGAAQAGVPLTVRIAVLDGDNGCVPYNGAHVDIWHANAYGLYSDESGQMTGGGTANGNTSGQNFLRGFQVTGADAGVEASPVDGQVSFRTIWPGWYSGRAIHIHVRVRAYDASGSVATNYTTQIFFSDADNKTVLTGAAPYSSRSPQDDPTSNETDMVMTSAARATNIAPVTGSVGSGFATTFTIVLTGLPAAAAGASSGSAGKAVDASLRSAKVSRAANGSRALVLSVRAGEALTARARLLRGSRVLASGTGKLAAGTHSLRVAIASGAAAGTATAELTLVDADGNKRVVKRTVTIPG